MNTVPMRELPLLLTVPFWNLRSARSICTGEQVAGFVDRKTGKFQEVAMIASEEDLEQFLKTYQISRQELKKIF